MTINTCCSCRRVFWTDDLPPITWSELGPWGSLCASRYERWVFPGACDDAQARGFDPTDVLPGWPNL